MSIPHLAAIGSLLSMLLLVAACEGIEIKPSRGGHGGHGGGDSGSRSGGSRAG